MSYLLNEADAFTADMVDGFVAAHGDLVRRVEGGVVRAARARPGHVAVVIGGGSGHYPAFAGLVGTGLAHGAAMGGVFASPSARQVYAVAKAAASDAGVLLSYGNYAGDVLNFSQAQRQLQADGIPTATAVVTDDISSAPASDRGSRRGVAGDLVVFRAAGWAADQGQSLAEVSSLANRANERTRTLGVAFSGCTLPGAAAPLFTVPTGQMAIGMGIHGEPGMEQRPVPTADGLAQLLVERLLDEQPDDLPGSGHQRVAVILNGLGSVKSEELYITYKGIAERLNRASMSAIAPEVGEFATSFEMAGVSLTLTWLDEELERAWTGPATAPGFRRGPQRTPAPDRTDADARPAAEQVIIPGSADSQAAAQLILAALDAVRQTLAENIDELGRLDAVAGDGDHGIGMHRGAVAAAEAAENAVHARGGASTTLGAAADAWANRAGGTSGALWGVGLRAVAERLPDDDAVTAAAVAAGVRAAADAVAEAGKARLRDKTLLDALYPFADRLCEQTAAGQPLRVAWHAAAEEASTAAAATCELAPRIGRARIHQTESVGVPDPGAISFALAAASVAAVLDTRKAART